ncbi:hypothetical protein A4A49_13985 [Nicotiana attenuata]|uniref:Uncharacterized protein n=1 Tax=Nicotiana attenuata TaxID=49451 RepID=A0A314KT51_NICAT|nr:hypothetical protein A4A49_13985 [Nicotiana attenuata]
MVMPHCTMNADWSGAVSVVVDCADAMLMQTGDLVVSHGFAPFSMAFFKQRAIYVGLSTQFKVEIRGLLTQLKVEIAELVFKILRFVNFLHISLSWIC